MIRFCNSETVYGFIEGRHSGIGEIRVSLKNAVNVRVIK